ncbi:MAG: hypothetical protein ACYDCO_25580 [Armatimonadota bacterium]
MTTCLLEIDAPAAPVQPIDRVTLAYTLLERLMAGFMTLEGAIDTVECHEFFKGHLPADFRLQANRRYREG